MKTNVNLSLFLSLILLPHIVNAFDITQILDQYPDFSTFKNYLTQVNLVTEINSRQTITVLVVDNGNMSPLSGKPPQVLANIMSVHVILDYFDVPKLQMLPETPTTLTTLFQATGRARGQQGFLNVTRVGTDGIAFGSPAVAGAAPSSNLVKSVFTQPYNISVLQISNVILPPRADAPARVPSAAPQPPAPTPSKSQTQTPTTTPSASPSGTQAPPMSPNTSSPMVPPTPSVASPPSKAPLPGAATPTPTVADDPSSATPASSPGAATEGPAAAAVETPPPPADDSKPAGAGKTRHIGLAVVVAVAVSTISLAMRV